MLVLTLLICGTEILGGTEIFTAPSLSSAQIIADGRGFFIDRSESRLVFFDLETGLMKVMASEGPGPADLERPRRVAMVWGRLFVPDHRGGLFFTPEGEFVERIRIPQSLTVLPTADGWFGSRGLSHQDLSQPLEALILDRDFGVVSRLGSWSSEVSRGARLLPRRPMSVDPTRAVTLFRVDQTGEYAYVKPEGIDVISIFDLEAEKGIGAIELEERPIPFDEAWGNAQIEDFREMFREQGIQVPIVPEFPDRFPLVRNFFVTVENRVAVELWHPAVDQRKERRIRAFDLLGRPLETNRLDRLWFHLIFADEERVVLWVYNPDLEEYTIGRCRRDELEEFLGKYPLYDPID